MHRVPKAVDVAGATGLQNNHMISLLRGFTMDFAELNRTALDGHRWHAGCFRCGCCRKQIGPGTIWTEPSHPGIPYCSNVCLATVHNPCTVCGEPLIGMVGPQL